VSAGASHVLALDSGTTGTTVLVVDGEGQLAGSAYAELAQYFPRPGWVEHDPAEIWSAVVGATSAALESAGLTAADLAGVGIANQRETTVVWERSSGEPVYRAIVWQDRRSTEICRRLVADGAGPLVSQRTGLLLDPYFSATKLAWLFEHVDGLRARSERGEICFGTVDSWLVWKMTGGAVHATDVTNASRTLLMDLAEVDWDDELCALFGVPRAMLPEIRPSSHVFGECDSELFEGAHVPVASVVGDQQAALFGQACFERGRTKNTYGTGSFVLQHAGIAPPAERGSLVATLACTPDGSPAEYALEGSIFATGAAVQWLRDGLGIVREAGETEALAASLNGNDDVWLVPALSGLGAPVWDPSARGTLLGATRGTTRAHLARAALESIAYQSRDVLEEMAALGQPVAELRVDGGAAANNWLMQFQADVAGVPVDVATRKETTGLGAAYAAGLATGVWADRAELERLRRSSRRFEPAMSATTRDALYERWLQARSRALGWARPDA
jgi:glycerol kinase